MSQPDRLKVIINGYPAPVPARVWIDQLPRLRMTGRAFMALPEYSCTLPTGVILGKRWRRLDGAHDQSYRAAGGVPAWVIGEYGPSEKGDEFCKVRWFKPVLKCGEF